MNRAKHCAHAKRCLGGLGAKAVEHDCNRTMIAFYCLSTLDLLSTYPSSGTSTSTSPTTDLNLAGRSILEAGDIKSFEADGWKEWIWTQYTQGEWGAGFRDSSSMSELPNLIITYTALLSLAILRDDFQNLDREGLKKFLKSVQCESGAFATSPVDAIASSEEEINADVRMTYCAFVICSLLDDFTCIDLEKALEFVRQCRTYEGAYGQVPGLEGHGGPTYCSLAALYLAPASKTSQPLSKSQVEQTLRWLSHNQVFLEDENAGTGIGGFRGRTEKEADACYSFWCCASVEILRSHVNAETTDSDLTFIDKSANARWVERCMFKWGGVAKTPGEMPDPYHTYLALASVAVSTPTSSESQDNPLDQTWWDLPKVDPLINGRVESVAWARDKIGQTDKLRAA